VLRSNGGDEDDLRVGVGASPDSRGAVGDGDVDTDLALATGTFPVGDDDDEGGDNGDDDEDDEDEDEGDDDRSRRSRRCSDGLVRSAADASAPRGTLRVSHSSFRMRSFSL
jgi:hypothetical protein